MAIQITEIDAGVFSKAEVTVDFGLIGSGLAFSDQFFGVIGRLENQTEIDLGIQGKALSEADTGVLGRAIAEVGWGLRAEPTPIVVETLPTHLTPDLVMASDIRTREVYTELHLTYDYDYAEVKYRKGLRFFNTEAENRFGKNVLRITSKWLRRNRDAVIFGKVQLKYWSTPQWQVNFTTPADRRIINIGEDIILEHPLVNSTRQYTVLQADYNIDQLEQFLLVEIPAFDNQVIEVSLLSSSFTNELDEIFTGVISEGIAEFTLRSPEGRLLISVPVSIDGGGVKTTDRFGRVRFEATPGEHIIFVDLGDPSRNMSINITI